FTDEGQRFARIHAKADAIHNRRGIAKPDCQVINFQQDSHLDPKALKHVVSRLSEADKMFCV
ncbi:MAG: hypothetical protein ACI80I_000944, partial [Akkermansiaceae bacterium]